MMALYRRRLNLGQKKAVASTTSQVTEGYLICGGRVTIEESDDDVCAVGRSGAASAPVSVHRRHEAGPAARGDAGSGGAAGPVLAMYRRGRGARRTRSDPSWAPAHTTRPDTASCGRAGDHYDRRDGGHGGWRSARASAAISGGGAPRRLRRV